MTRLITWLDRHYVPLLAALLLLLLALAAAVVVAALPPREFTILTGREGAGYYRAAQEYRRVLVDRGYTLNIETTSGSVETLQRLAAGEASIGFVQGGITAAADPAGLSTLAGVFYEPVWIFYDRAFGGEEPLVHLYELRGGRVNLGEVGSGANELARQLLAANGLNDDNTTFLELPADEAAAALVDGRLDAALFVVAANSDTIRTLLRDPALELMDVARADAYRAQFPFLTTVTLAEGAIDLVAGLPAADKHLIATAANLVIRDDLHPELIRLMTLAAVETHAGGGLFERRFEFPNYNHAYLPAGREQRAYLERLKAGEKTLADRLPYWAAALLDRWALFVVPVALLLLLLVGRRARLSDYFLRRKVERWRDVIRRIDVAAPRMAPAEVAVSLAALAGLERQIQEESLLSDRHQAVFYDLYTHLHQTREALMRRQGEHPTNKI